MESNNNKISIRSIHLNDLYNSNSNPYKYFIYTSGNGMRFKPRDIMNYFIEYKVNEHFLIIE